MVQAYQSESPEMFSVPGRHWLHSEMWWPRLFKGGPEIAWDDYEKDYSDLPAAILAEHEAVEAEQEVQRSLDASERREKELSKAHFPFAFHTLHSTRHNPQSHSWHETSKSLQITCRVGTVAQPSEGEFG